MYSISKFSLRKIELLSQEQYSNFQSKKLTVATRLLILTQPINIFNAFLFAFLFHHKVDDITLSLLVGLICSLSIGWLTYSLWDVVKGVMTTPTKKTFRIHYTFTALVSIACAGLCTYLFGFSNYEEKLVIVATYIGMICAGAFALTTLPKAVFFWILPQMLMGIIGIIKYLETTYLIIALCVLLVIYSTSIFITALFMYRMYILRLTAEGEMEVQRKNAEKRQQMVGLLLRDIESQVNDWLWELDSSNKISYLPTKLIEMIDVEIEELTLNRLFSSFFTSPLKEQQEQLDLLQIKINQQEHFTGLIIPAYIDGNHCWLSLTGKPNFDDNGEFIGWRGFCSDITQEHKHTQEIEYLADFDTLTKLPNRRQFNEFLNSLQDSPQKFEILLIDLDNFKQINDSLGRNEGDLLLVDVAQRLSTQVQARDFLARVGGDTFVLISFEQSLKNEIAATLLETLNAPCQLTNIAKDIQACIGVCKEGDSPTDMFNKAELAMKSAKSLGNNNFVIFNKYIEDKVNRRNELISALRNAIPNNELSLVFQPQIDVETNDIKGFEALLRWERPGIGFISPDEFIPLAEEYGIIISIGHWVLSQACIQAKEWPVEISVAVNVSGAQFMSTSFFDTVNDILSETGLSPARLELEVTESAIINDINIVNETLTKLQKLNIRIALDDFGTGFSSLSYLQKLSINKLKIDRAFVSELDNDNGTDSSIVIIKIIIELAKALHLNITVEGVETKEQLRIVESMGCYNIQGYLMSRPLSPQHTLNFIKHFNR